MRSNFQSILQSILRMVILGLTLTLTLTGCQTMDKGSGSGSGISFGTRPAQSSPAPGLENGPLSGSLGQELTQSAKTKALAAELLALRSGLTGSPTRWKDGESTTGQVIPQQVYEVGNSLCRRYEHEIVVNGSVKKDFGTACKGSDGVWRSLQ